jgi:hypothetical protein
MSGFLTGFLLFTMMSAPAFSAPYGAMMLSSNKNISRTSATPAMSPKYARSATARLVSPSLIKPGTSLGNSVSSGQLGGAVNNPDLTDLKNRTKVLEDRADYTDARFITTGDRIDDVESNLNNNYYNKTDIDQMVINNVPDLTGYATETYVNNYVATIISSLPPSGIVAESDPTVPAWAKAATKPTYNYSEITGTPMLATVATSGSYNDLSDKPQIPSPYVWGAEELSGRLYAIPPLTITYQPRQMTIPAYMYISAPTVVTTDNNHAITGIITVPTPALPVLP